VTQASAESGEVVVCATHRAQLAARTCAKRHVARDDRGHRYLRVLGREARWATCASCSLGAAAALRLGVPGTPGALPHLPPSRITFRPVAEPSRARERALTPTRLDYLDYLEGGNLRIVRHPLDALALGIAPWGAL